MVAKVMLRRAKVLLLRIVSDNENKQTTEMGLTDPHVSEFDGHVAPCFLQAVERLFSYMDVCRR